MKSLLLSLALLAFFLTPAQAADDGLYDPVAPAGSAFVRVINTGLERSAVEPEIRGKKYDEVEYGAIGPYVPVPAGKAPVAIGTLGKDIEVAEGGFYSLAVRGNDVIVFKDAALTDPAKALVTLYNLTGRDGLALKTADDKKIEIVPPVVSKKSGERPINPLPVKMAVFDGEQATPVPADATLKRGAVTNILVREGDGDNLNVTAFFSVTDTTQ